jgi:glutathione S-transferase
VELVILVVMLALIQYTMFAVAVGNSRVKYGVKAPAMAGHAMFERALRVQMNTLEQLIIFIPAIFSFAWLADSLDWPGSESAAALGVIYLIGRHLYARAYMQDPMKRSMGFMLTFVPSALLIAGALVCVLFTVVR